MRDFLSLPDYVLQLTGMTTEYILLILLFYVPLAPQSKILRVYLGCSLLRSAVLIYVAYGKPLSTYIFISPLAQIGGHALLIVLSVELMGLMIVGQWKSAAAFYMISASVLLVLAINNITLPLDVGQFMLFAEKSTVLTVFALIFTLAYARYSWPYHGIAVSLTVMLALDLGCVLFRNWSVAHDRHFYTLVRYSFPAASDIGYILMLIACVWPKPEHPPATSLEALGRMLRILKEHKEALKQI